MSTIFEHIKDLIFYVKTHYENYLKQKGIQKFLKKPFDRWFNLCIVKKKIMFVLLYFRV